MMESDTAAVGGTDTEPRERTDDGALLNVDSEGRTYYFQPATQMIIAHDGGNVAHRETLDERTLSEWVASIRECGAWDDTPPPMSTVSRRCSLRTCSERPARHTNFSSPRRL